MKVKELKQILSEVPDDYDIRSRAINSNLCEDEIPWQLSFAKIIVKVKRVDKLNTIVLIRGYE